MAELDSDLSIGPYQVVGRLGGGAMGTVHLARSPGGRLVAVKVARPELAGDPRFRERFRREIEAARAVGGFWTAAVVDADPSAPRPWLATEYVPGPDLHEAVRASGALPPESVRGLAAGLAEALAAIHAAGVVHRDLKPSNVLLAADGPRVIDFGIAKALEGAGLTHTGMVVGTPGYLSPEQIEGREVGPASDVFAFGAVLAFAASGRNPFGEGDTAALLYRAVHTRPDLRDVPPDLRELVTRCLEYKARARPTALELVAELGGTTRAEWLPSAVRTMVEQRQTEVVAARPPTRVLPADHLSAKARWWLERGAPAHPPAHPGPPNPSAPHPAASDPAAPLSVAPPLAAPLPAAPPAAAAPHSDAYPAAPHPGDAQQSAPHPAGAPSAAHPTPQPSLHPDPAPGHPSQVHPAAAPKVGFAERLRRAMAPQPVAAPNQAYPTPAHQTPLHQTPAYPTSAPAQPAAAQQTPAPPAPVQPAPAHPAPAQPGPAQSAPAHAASAPAVPAQAKVLALAPGIASARAALGKWWGKALGWVEQAPPPPPPAPEPKRELADRVSKLVEQAREAMVDSERPKAVKKSKKSKTAEPAKKPNLPERKRTGNQAVFTAARGPRVVAAGVGLGGAALLAAAAAEAARTGQQAMALLVFAVAVLLALVAVQRIGQAVAPRRGVEITAAGLSWRRGATVTTLKWPRVARVRIVEDKDRPWLVVWPRDPSSLPAKPDHHGGYRVYPIAHGKAAKARAREIGELRAALQWYGRSAYDDTK
ncbi:protein kinase [Actinokineospora guangxiensis]|uniref:non-specific serine/threonine protein kinase n=1 Tax=Actinokineospora guangxiensis TaxID=1490288 RepID=A0ABW0ERZ4_9PSEU